MDKRLVKAWIKALRSGKYLQGQGELYNSEANTYCCLGVACHIVAKKQKKSVFAVARNHKTDHICNDSVARKFGLNALAHKDDGDGTQADLAIMNDGGSSFNEIADWIERNILKAA